ncbi:MAG TPA: LacI family DNA-binding transcriptional regulator [Lachnospiraceae bacterium]
MPITIEDIAKEAGVSIATVSRVINGTKSVSPELKQRVMNSIEKNNFKPNTLARGLSKNKVNTIGVIVSDISNFVISSVIKGCSEICRDRQYTVVVCESGGDKKRERELLYHMDVEKVSGLLLCGFDVDKETTELIMQMSYPTVLVTQRASDGECILNTVSHNSEQLIIDGVSFLIANGHKRIAFIGGIENDYYNGKMRKKGYEICMQEHGLEVPESYIVHGDFTFESGYNCMKKIYEENMLLPTAVMSCSDLMAVGALRYAQDQGLKVPEELSILGVDDADIAKYVRPALSTVRIDYLEEGKKATKELFDLIDTEQKYNGNLIYVDHKVIRRASVRVIEGSE